MQFNSRMLQLYAITDRRWLNGKNLSQAVEEALLGGVTCLQFRDKEKRNVCEIRKINTLCKKFNVPFIINDDPYLALECDADGVHIGQNDIDIKEARRILGKNRIIGVTVHNLREAEKAQKDGADYLGIGSVFGTSTKNDTKPVSKDLLRRISGSVRIPTVAIGGINPKNIEKLDGSGIDGVAVVSAIFNSEDIKKSARELYFLTNRLFCKKEIKKVLTVAGTDCSGGAGVQADIKTITANKLYAMSVITALTAQNTVGVDGIINVGTDFIAKQFDCVFSDIYPDSVKIGMVSTAQIAEVISEKLREYGARNIVLDPVMVSTSGSSLMSDNAVLSVIDNLFPLARIVTPNVMEAEVLSGFAIKSEKDMEQAAKIIFEKYGAAVLVKGGHRISEANDILVSENGAEWFRERYVNNPNTHGTGCTLSSAIACNLALGYSLEKSVELAKKYLTGAILAGLDLGKGHGPLKHTYNLK